MEKNKHIVEEQVVDYHKAELDLLRKGLTSSYTERFHTMARLMKLNLILKSATVVHKKID